MYYINDLLDLIILGKQPNKLKVKIGYTLCNDDCQGWKQKLDTIHFVQWWLSGSWVCEKLKCRC